MTTKLKLSSMAVVALLYTLTSMAQQVPPALDSLFRLEGKWESQATLVLEGNPFNLTYYVDFKKNAENTGMSMEETFTHPDLGTLKGYNLIGYNNRDNKIHWMSLDNFGTCHEHLGYWKTPQHFYMEVTEKQNGKKFEEKIDLIFQNANQMTLHLVATLGNKIIEDAFGTFTRQSGAKTNKKQTRIAREETLSAFGLYPNPARTSSTLQLPGFDKNKNTTLDLFNSMGQRVKELTITTPVSTISLEGLRSGVYVYKVNIDNVAINTGKIIIQ